MLWGGELAQLAALSRRGSSMGLHVTLSKGTSDLVGGRSKAVSCSMAMLRSLVSRCMATSWSAAVLKPLAQSIRVLHLERRNSRRRRAVVALGGVGAWCRVNPGQEENRRLHCVENWHCLISAGSALGVDFLLTSTQKGHCNPPQRLTTTRVALIISST